MPQILYKARGADGADVTGYVDADTAQAAVAKLKAAGLTDVELHESPDIAARRSDRAAHIGAGADSAARLAAFELKVRRQPGLATVLGEVARRARWAIAVDVLLVVAGLALRLPWLAGTGVVALLLTFGLPTWRHRSSRRFARLTRSLAVGDWAQARVALEAFRKLEHPANIVDSIAFYDAQLRVREGEPLHDVLARLDRLQAHVPRAHFLARRAAVHSAARDYDGFLADMGAAWDASADDPARRVDFALAHARFGNLVKARELLDGLPLEALPVHGRAFVHWARGLVALRNDRPEALAILTEGVAGFLQHTSAASWSALALCSGACALALQRSGDTAAARTMLARVAPVLRAHADARLQAEITREIGPF